MKFYVGTRYINKGGAKENENEIMILGIVPTNGGDK